MALLCSYGDVSPTKGADLDLDPPHPSRVRAVAVDPRLRSVEFVSCEGLVDLAAYATKDNIPPQWLCVGHRTSDVENALYRLD